MQIAELTAFHIRIPLRKPIRHASHMREYSDNIVVRCVLTDGTTGYGEGVPREYVNGDTIDLALSLLRRAHVLHHWQACASLEQVVEQVERLALPPITEDDRQRQENPARCALEMAVLDAYCRSYGQSLAAVIPLVAPELYAPRQGVRYSGAITSANGFKLRLAAWKLRVYRFRQVKLKVGIPGYDDAQRLRHLRRILGSSVELRVDANEAWSPEQAADQIRALEPYGITSVEQPLAQEANPGLVGLRQAVRTPILLDESLCSMVDAEQAVSQGWCDHFNLRLSKCGGLVRTLRLAQFASRQGIGYQLGCMVGESAILSAAGRQLASQVRGWLALEGSYDRHLLRANLAKEDITFTWGGKAPALTGPGLGINIDPLALEGLSLRKEVLDG